MWNSMLAFFFELYFADGGMEFEIQSPDIDVFQNCFNVLRIDWLTHGQRLCFNEE